MLSSNVTRNPDKVRGEGVEEFEDRGVGRGGTALCFCTAHGARALYRSPRGQHAHSMCANPGPRDLHRAPTCPLRQRLSGRALTATSKARALLRAHWYPSWLGLSRVAWASLALGRCRGSHLVADESPYPNLATLSRIKSACSRGGAQWRGEDNRWGMCSRGVRGRLPVRTGSCLHEQSAWGGVLEGVYPPGASTTHGSNYAHTQQRVASTFRDKVASELSIT